MALFCDLKSQHDKALTFLDKVRSCMDNGCCVIAVGFSCLQVDEIVHPPNDELLMFFFFNLFFLFFFYYIYLL